MNFLMRISQLQGISLANKNVFYNLVGGIWLGSLLLLVTPQYVKILGFDGYGVLGFWLLIQGLISLLDIGVGAALVREFSKKSGLDTFSIKKQDILRTLEFVYLGLTLIAIIFLLSLADWISTSWLSSNVYSSDYLRSVISQMGLAVGVQFFCSLYTNALIGLQRQRDMNILQIIFNSSRHIFGLLVIFYTQDLGAFFLLQLLIAIAQLLVSRYVVRRAISPENSFSSKFKLKIIVKMWRFSAGMAMTAFSGIMIANADRIVLSKLVMTDDLGKYAVAFTAAGLIQMGIQPFYRAYFPRFSELVSSNSSKLNNIYFSSNFLMATFLIPLVLIGILFAPQLIETWLGSPQDEVVSIFRWLIIGIGLSGLMWLPVALQHAHGWSSLHVKMMILALIIGVPLTFYMIGVYGVIGGVTVWVVHGFLEVTLGIFLMHRRILVGQLFSWVIKIPVTVTLLATPIIGISFFFLPENMTIIPTFIWLVVTGFITVFCIFAFGWKTKILSVDLI